MRTSLAISFQVDTKRKRNQAKGGQPLLSEAVPSLSDKVITEDNVIPTSKTNLRKIRLL